MPTSVTTEKESNIDENFHQEYFPSKQKEKNGKVEVVDSEKDADAAIIVPYNGCKERFSMVEHNPDKGCYQNECGIKKEGRPGSKNTQPSWMNEIRDEEANERTQLLDSKSLHYGTAESPSDNNTWIERLLRKVLALILVVAIISASILTRVFQYLYLPPVVLNETISEDLKNSTPPSNE